MTNKIDILAVGDITLGNHLLTAGFGIRDIIEKRGNHYIFQFVRSLLRESDITFGNLESVLSDASAERGNIKSMFFRGSPSAVDTLSDGGFDILNIANNHSLHHGVDAFKETTELLKKKDLLVLGLAGEDDYSAAPVVHRIKDIKLGFLGYSFVRENYYGGRPLYALGDLGNVINDIKRLKREVDFVVVSCHWGLEIINRPSLHTIEMARAMIDHGADVIFGHHPHVFQAIERYKSGLIFYSLGNFVFDCLWEKEYVRSAIVKVTLQRGEKISYDLIPIRINSGYQPVPLTGSDEKAFLSYVSDISNKDYYDNYQDLEESCLNYYVEYNRCEKSAVYKKILFLMRRLHKVKFSVLAMVFWEKFLKKVLPL